VIYSNLILNFKKIKNMKKIILIILISFFFGISWVFANEVDHFDVKIISNSNKIDWNKTYPLEIRALDKYWKIVTDYESTVLIFSEIDKKAIFSKELEDNSFIFTKDNKGVIYFSDWIKFSWNWLIDIHVYDLEDNTDSVMWFKKIEVYWLYSNINNGSYNNISNKSYNTSNLSKFNIIIWNNHKKIVVNKFYPLKIEALDTYWKVVNDLETTLLIFSESDSRVKLSNKIIDNSYNILKNDNWILYFKEWIMFSKTGLNDLHVYDLNDESDERNWKIKIEVYDNEKEVKLFIEIDKKINRLIYKNSKKNNKEKIRIYNNFIKKINKISSIEKYNKYYKILNYIKQEISKELEKLWFNKSKDEEIKNILKKIWNKDKEKLKSIITILLEIKDKDKFNKSIILYKRLLKNFFVEIEKVRVIIEFSWFIENISNENLSAKNKEKIIDLLESLLFKDEIASDKNIYISALKSLTPNITESVFIVKKLNEIKNSNNIESNKKKWEEILKIISETDLMTLKEKNDYKAILKILIYSK